MKLRKAGDDMADNVDLAGSQRWLASLILDPKLLDRDAAAVSRLHAELEAHRQAARSNSLPGGETPALSPDEREKLRALGYAD